MENEKISCIDFLSQLEKITVPQRSEIRDVLTKLADPSKNFHYFWYLSKMIKNSKIEDLVNLAQLITETLVQNQTKYLSAAFAAASFVSRMSEIPTEFAPKEIVFPTNPIISAQYIKILRPNLPLNLLLPFLDYPNLSFQKSAAYAIYNLTEDKTQLQKQALNSLIQAEESLPFPTEAPNLNIRNTGIIVLCMYLTDQPILISEYMKALYPILLDETQKNAATQAQLLLSTLMKYNSTEFHHFDILSLVRKQFEHHNLRPQFLLSFINTFGIYSIRKFCIEVLSQCIEDFDTNGLQYIKVFIPYLMHFPYEKQLELHKFLTEQCEKRRFDSELFITTAKSFAAIAPTVSLYCGRFMEAAKLSFVNSSVKAILRPLLEPNGPQPPQEVHNIIVLADDEKCDVETLAEPSTVSVGVQYESI